MKLESEEEVLEYFEDGREVKFSNYLLLGSAYKVKELLALNISGYPWIKEMAQQHGFELEMGERSYFSVTGTLRRKEEWTDPKKSWRGSGARSKKKTEDT